MNFSITTIPGLRTEQGRQRAKNIGVPSLMTAGAVMVATRKPKNAEQNMLKFTTRLSRSAKAGLITAAVVAVLSLNKEKVQAGVEKVKDFFTSKFSKNKEEEPKTQAQTMSPQMEADKMIEPKMQMAQQNSANIFSQVSSKV